MAFTVKFDPRAQDLVRRLMDFTGAGAAIGQAIDHQNQITIGHIVQHRLSFPASLPPTLEGLRVHTNRLRGSIRATKSKVVGRRVESAIGSNVKYAGVHEYGFQGTVQVPEHRRRNTLADRFKLGGMEFSRAALMKMRRSPDPEKQAASLQQTKKVASGAYVNVRAHPMRMNVPARAYIERELVQDLPAYGERISQAVIDFYAHSLD